MRIILSLLFFSTIALAHEEASHERLPDISHLTIKVCIEGNQYYYSYKGSAMEFAVPAFDKEGKVKKCSKDTSKKCRRTFTGYIECE